MTYEPTPGAQPPDVPASDALAAGGVAFFDGEPLLRIIATAVVELSVRGAPGDPVYPDSVQNALNQLVLLCLRRGVPPPSSVPEMAEWAVSKPLRDWPLGLPPDFEAAEAYLVDAETLLPTQACLEWVVAARDPAAEQYENRLMEQVLGVCRAARDPEAYSAFRQLLITRPTLTGDERGRRAAHIDLSLLDAVIKTCYEPAPAAYLRGDRFAVCGRCGSLLVPYGTSGYKCELDRCRRDGPAQVAEFLDRNRPDGVYHLARPLRMFITGPGLAELDLEARFVKLGLAPEMWPGFDAYDLRVTFPDRQVWAIDVKDRANPALLGKTVRAFRTDPRFDQAFLVVPQYRFDQRSGYARVFARYRSSDLPTSVGFLSDTDLIKRAKQKLRTIERRRAAEAAAGGLATGLASGSVAGFAIGEGINEGVDTDA